MALDPFGGGFRLYNPARNFSLMGEHHFHLLASPTMWFLGELQCFSSSHLYNHLQEWVPDTNQTI